MFGKKKGVRDKIYQRSRLLRQPFSNEKGAQRAANLYFKKRCFKIEKRGFRKFVVLIKRSCGEWEAYKED